MNGKAYVGVDYEDRILRILVDGSRQGKRLPQTLQCKLGKLTAKRYVELGTVAAINSICANFSLSSEDALKLLNEVRFGCAKYLHCKHDYHTKLDRIAYWLHHLGPHHVSNKDIRYLQRGISDALDNKEPSSYAWFIVNKPILTYIQVYVNIRLGALLSSKGNCLCAHCANAGGSKS